MRPRGWAWHHGLMKLVPTRRTDYAIQSLVYIANSPTTPVKANAVGEVMGIPTGFLQQVLRELLAGRTVDLPIGTLRWVPPRPAGRGDHRAPDRRGAWRARCGRTECALRGGPCHWYDVCALHRVWSAARDSLCDRLDEATLATVAADDRALAAGVLPIPDRLPPPTDSAG